MVYFPFLLVKSLILQGKSSILMVLQVTFRFFHGENVGFLEISCPAPGESRLKQHARRVSEVPILASGGRCQMIIHFFFKSLYVYNCTCTYKYKYRYKPKSYTYIYNININIHLYYVYIYTYIDYGLYAIIDCA
jgi:hypothetical protein